MGSGEFQAGDTGGRYVASYTPEGAPGLSLYPSQGHMTIQSVRTTFHAISMAITIKIVRIVNFLQNVKSPPDRERRVLISEKAAMSGSERRLVRFGLFFW